MPKKITSKTGEVHFIRATLIKLPFFSVCLHKIFKADEDPYLHNHPWNFINVVLSGSYKESLGGVSRIKTPLSINFYRRSVFHKIEKIIKGPVITLNFMVGRRKQWGYKTPQGFKSNEVFRRCKGKRYWIIEEFNEGTFLLMVNRDLEKYEDVKQEVGAKLAENNIKSLSGEYDMKDLDRVISILENDGWKKTFIPFGP